MVATLFFAWAVGAPAIPEKAKEKADGVEYEAYAKRMAKRGYKPEGKPLVLDNSIPRSFSIGGKELKLKEGAEIVYCWVSNGPPIVVEAGNEKSFSGHFDFKGVAVKMQNAKGEVHEFNVMEALPKTIPLEKANSRHTMNKVEYTRIVQNFQHSIKVPTTDGVRNYYIDLNYWVVFVKSE